LKRIMGERRAMENTCFACKKEGAEFPINLTDKAGYLCNLCTAKIPTHVFVLCRKCGNVAVVEVEEYYREDMIRGDCIEVGMDKVETARELLTMEWTPLVLTVISCNICS